MSGRIRKEDLHDTLLNQVIPFAVSTGLKNVYSISTSPAPIALVAGMAVSVQINVASDAASTLNWNGLGAKGIKKANGTDITNLKLNGIYTLRYDGVNFMLQGEGAGGNAVAGDLLINKTATTDAGDIVGTMPENNALTVTPSSAAQNFPAGHYTGVTVNPIPATAGDTIIATNNNNVNTMSTVMTKFREYKITAAGSYRIAFSLWNSDTSSYISYGQLYRNGVPIGALRQTNAGASVTMVFTEDISGWSINDLLQLYLKTSDGTKYANENVFQVSIFTSNPVITL
jgi:hypothetical protein